MTHTVRRFVLPALLLATTVTLTACSNEDGSASTSPMSATSSGTSTGEPTPSTEGTPASGPHNAADVKFATAMIPHHGQALEMADMAMEKATDPRVKEIASAIQSAQMPEIIQMSGWLRGWDEPVPDPSMGSMDHGMEMGDMDMGGMMSDDDMARLDDATGAGFDRMWLTMMVAHHEGAVMMAETEQRDGKNRDAMDLAGAIIAGQSQEISTMKDLLSQM